MSLRNRVVDMSGQELRPEGDEILALEFAAGKDEITSVRSNTITPTEYPSLESPSV